MEPIQIGDSQLESTWGPHIVKKMEDLYNKVSPNDKSNAELCFYMYREAFRRYCAPMETRWEEIDTKQKLVWVAVAQGFEPIWATKQQQTDSTQIGG